MLEQGLSRIKPTECPIIHSDQGVLYGSAEWVKMLEGKAVQSMSRRGNCYDNAVIESFFAILKSECFYSRTYHSIAELQAEIEEYLCITTKNELIEPSTIQSSIFKLTNLSNFLGADQSAVKNLNDFIKAQKTDSPWFAYLDLALETKNPSDYDRTLQDLDSLLAKALETTPLENTLVIITSEHGLTFNEMNEKE